jgi:hypothetical protein
MIVSSASLPLKRGRLRSVGLGAVSKNDSLRVMSVLILLVHSRTWGQMYSMNALDFQRPRIMILSLE